MPATPPAPRPCNEMPSTGGAQDLPVARDDDDVGGLGTAVNAAATRSPGLRVMTTAPPFGVGKLVGSDSLHDSGGGDEHDVVRTAALATAGVIRSARPGRKHGQHGLALVRAESLRGGQRPCLATMHRRCRTALALRARPSDVIAKTVAWVGGEHLSLREDHGAPVWPAWPPRSATRPTMPLVESVTMHGLVREPRSQRAPP